MLDITSRLDADRVVMNLNKSQQYLDAFENRFSRFRRVLHFVASRILGGSADAEKAVNNCYFSASRERRAFEYEGAFRSWLVRILIDEALAILRQGKTTQ